MFGRSALALLAWAVICLPALGQLPDSGETEVEPHSTAASVVDLSHWWLLAGYANIQVSAQSAPDSSPAVEVDVTQDKGVSVQNQLISATDLRTYDSFAFWIRGSATRSPNFAYLVDVNGGRRWYPLYLQAPHGWVQQQYWISGYYGQDPGFNLSKVAAVKFNQAGEVAGDQIWISAVTFEHNAVNHAEAAGSWVFDIPGNIGDSIQAVTDAVVGSFSVQATGHASSDGQMDIATSRAATGAMWDWSSKSFLTFYYKDSYPDVSHYAAIYDSSGNYREWVFTNPSPGSWVKVTVALNDNSYFAYASPGPPDLSKVISFETGIFGAVPYSAYTFQVDELSAY